LPYSALAIPAALFAHIQSIAQPSCSTSSRSPTSASCACSSTDVALLLTASSSEDLVIETIYSGLLKGRLDQRRQRLDVEWVTGRDVAPVQVEALAKDLAGWSGKIAEVIALLDHQIRRVQHEECVGVRGRSPFDLLIRARAHRSQRRHEKEHYTAQVDKVLAEIGPRASANAGGGGSWGPGDGEPGRGASTVPWSTSANVSRMLAKDDVMDIDAPDEAGAGRGKSKASRKRLRN
jgi:COP9 signalosome complex subunit 7